MKLTLFNILFEKKIDVPTKSSFFYGEKYTEDPTKKQIDKDNYYKPKLDWNGLDLALENPKGTYRKGVDKDGNEWKNRIYYDYGEIHGYVGKDKDYLDFFMGPKPDSDFVFIIDQMKIDSDKFDEHKIMLGFKTKQEAIDAYLKNYDKDWKKRQGGKIQGVATDVEGLKDWLENRTKQKPANETINV